MQIDFFLSSVFNFIIIYYPWEIAFISAYDLFRLLKL